MEVWQTTPVFAVASLYMLQEAKSLALRWHLHPPHVGTQVAKSPAAPSAAVAFRVTTRGLEADATAPQLQQAAGSVVGQAIAHGMDYEPGGS